MLKSILSPTSVTKVPATLADYTDSSLIRARLSTGNPAAVIGELCSVLTKEGRVSDPLAFFNEVISRERLCSTAMAPGIALPHARIRGLQRMSFALGRCAKPLDWLQPDGEAVRLVFLFAVPDHAVTSYMSAISALARLTQDPHQMRDLLDAADGAAMLDILSRAQLPVTRREAVHS